MAERFIDWLKTHRGAAWAAIALIFSGVVVTVDIAKNTVDVFEFMARLLPTAPVSLTMAADDIAPLDGYPAIADDKLGTVLAGGGKARLFIQARSADEIVTIDRIRLNVVKLPEDEAAKFSYKIDPNKQPGQGSPEVHRYYVTFGPTGGSINYIKPEGAEPSAYPDLLAADPPRVMTLDSNSGLQEAIDLVLRPSEKGLYRVEIDARVMTKGGADEITSKPIYIVRQ
jgi:hypothetical protein